MCSTAADGGDWRRQVIAGFVFGSGLMKIGGDPRLKTLKSHVDVFYL